MTDSTATATSWPVRLDAAGVVLDGDLSIPPDARGLIVFAHGSGSSRHSPRNQAVANVLGRAHVATLLLDLLTRGEERADALTAEFRFDIPLLAQRVVAAIDWAAGHASSLPIGLFGASTGAAAALMAAAERPAAVRAAVSRGGRPDLAGAALEAVTAPTLLIVGGRDEVVLQLNRQAFARLTGVKEKELQIVPGATHLFEEPGALDQVTRLTTDWFLRHL